ncbi:MAG: ATP-binding protein [Pseudomonadota bacterium]
MLVEFSATNFRSISEVQKLTLVAGPGKEHLGQNTFDPGLAGFPRLLRSAVIYGANAAGKTNLLRALQFMQQLVVTSATFQEATRVAHSPFRLSRKTTASPSEFEVAFVDEGVRYEYGFSVDTNRVHKEWLIAYPRGRPQNWFERTFDAKKNTYEWQFSAKLKGSPRVWRDATRANALFLATATQLNSEQLRAVFQWFQKKLVVIIATGASQLNVGLTFQLLEQPDGKQKLLKFVKAADLGIDDLSLQRVPLAPMAAIDGNVVREPQPGGQIPSVMRVTSYHKASDSEQRVAMDLGDESSGTQALFHSAGAWLNVLRNGEVILYDELDTSLHPLMTRFLIGLFHDKSTNPKNAQLVFTTHDTSLLDSEIFRRDQVWFIEKDKKGASRLYPLSDFSPRKDEKLERGYLRGRYGALPFIGELKL